MRAALGTRGLGSGCLKSPVHVQEADPPEEELLLAFQVRQGRVAGSQRHSRSEDQDKLHRYHSNALVLVKYTQHATEDSSDSFEDDDKLEGTDKSRSRDKEIRKGDVSNPLSTFRKQW